mgnify:CR=1 FL=1
MTPTPENHFFVSMMKSVIRIMGCLTLIFNLTLGASLLAIAEVLGIIEEVV